MIILKESIHVKQNLEAVWKYTSDFGNIQEWDPGVSSSVTKQSGSPQVGTKYELVLKFGFSRPRMQYVITEYTPCSRVVLEGKGETFSATDIISFAQTPTGTRINYQAEIQLSGPSKRVEFLMAPILKVIGRKAVLGLKGVLNHKAKKKGSVYSRQKNRFNSGANLIDYIADHAILPGMLMFSKFGYSISKRFWTENDEILYGKQVVITGATSGIGKAAAIKLAEKKADLTIIARNQNKALSVCEEIIQQTKNPRVEFLVADLSLMTDIKHVAKQLIARKKTIDILINNAGALFNDREKTSEGLERTFATDLLGVFYLTQLLKDRFSRSGSARIINVSSGGMYTQKIDVYDLQNEQRPYNGSKAYARAKRGIVILTGLWAKKFQGDRIAVHSMHPGWVNTPGIETALPEFHSMVNSILRTPEQGADTIVWLASAKDPGQSTGRFWLDRRPRETVVFPNTAESEKERQMLWQELSRMTCGLPLFSSMKETSNFQPTRL